LIDELRDRYRNSLTKTCALFRMSRSLYRYQSVARDASAVLMRIKEIASARVHYEYRRVHVVLRLEGWLMLMKTDSISAVDRSKLR